MGRAAGSLAYCCRKLFLLLLSRGSGLSSPSAGGEDSGAGFPSGASDLDPLLVRLFLTFSLSWGSVEAAGASLAASGSGRASGGSSLAPGFPSACSSPPRWGSDARCLAPVLADLKDGRQTGRNSDWKSPKLKIAQNQVSRRVLATCVRTCACALTRWSSCPASPSARCCSVALLES